MTELLDRARATLEEGLKYPATMFYVRPGEFSAALRTVLDALSTLPDAVAGERERCARIAEEMSTHWTLTGDNLKSRIAAAIRKEPS